MKASELRIGNLVTVNDLFVTVHRIEEDMFWATHRNLLFFSGAETKPIPLTEEWLLKLGLKKTTESDSYWMDFDIMHQLSIVLSPKGYFPILMEEAELASDDPQCVNLNLVEHVHQLQNLYFALTGEELTIKL